MVRPGTNRFPLARLVVLACVITLFAGDLFRGVHLLTTRHVLCPEHGELIHADDAAPPARASSTTERAAIAPDGASPHHHNHCDVAAIRSNDGTAVVSGTACAVFDAPFAALALGPALGRPASLSVLSYAPKQSPPV